MNHATAHPDGERAGNMWGTQKKNNAEEEGMRAAGQKKLSGSAVRNGVPSTLRKILVIVVTNKSEAELV